MKKIEQNNIKKTSLTLPMIKGRISSLNNAINTIKKVLSSHKETLLLNHGVELSGLRSILGFASQYINC